MNILVTGGAGYIGSHTVVELLDQGYGVVLIDNFSNSSAKSIRRIQEITHQGFPFYEGDVCDKAILEKIFAEHAIDAVMHFAGLKAVAESTKEPLKYYRNNIGSSLTLCEVMQAANVKKLIFSSSATVYSDPKRSPLKETSSVGRGITHAYGHTKYIVEQILRDIAAADPTWQITALRYFNPIGAHLSGKIGEDPHDIPNNLMPYIAQVAVGRLAKLPIFGNDYATPDGTGVRDYIHVVDLAKGHVAALKHDSASGGMQVYNLGTGHGTSVLEVVRAFERASGKAVPYEILPRRPGDVTGYYADVSKAKRDLGWSAKKTLDEACADSWRWQSQSMPTG